jgi:ferredoxin-NADP reductase
MEQIVKIQSIEPVTHDVKRFRLEKPTGYEFIPGQATEVSINIPKWKEEKRPFTFTSLNEDPYLEFTIKIYSDHDGVTNALGKLTPGDELIIGDVWGAISYQGPGYFIAGGAGITPFIAILRDLARQNKTDGNVLFFSNKTPEDIILKDELRAILGDKAVFITTHEKDAAYHFGKIDRDYLKNHVQDFSKHFYVCGPDKMITDMNELLVSLGAKADTVVFEK